MRTLLSACGLVALSLTCTPVLSAALAGGNNPLPCSQGDEIRTIDYYMDLNMEELQAINQNQMDEAVRKELVEANTSEFMQLQDYRDDLIAECALEIRARNEYWEEQGIDPENAPPEQAPLDPQPDAETAGSVSSN